MEHVACGEYRLSVFVVFPFVAHEVSVSADDFFLFRVPHYELLVAVFASVKFVDIGAFSSAATSSTESYFAQTSDFLHHVRRVMSSHDIYFVIALVCHSELLVVSEFAHEHLFRNRFDDFFFVHLYLVVVISMLKCGVELQFIDLLSHPGSPFLRLLRLIESLVWYRFTYFYGESLVTVFESLIGEIEHCDIDFEMQ